MSFPTIGALSKRALGSGESYDEEFREAAKSFGRFPAGCGNTIGVDLNDRATWHLFSRP
jgi:hypothetical protein